MANEVAVRAPGVLAVITVTNEQKALVKSVIFPNSTDDELALFIFQCQRKGVHPLDKLIFPIKRNDSQSGDSKITFQSGIDFMRSQAEATGEYDGQDEPEFEWESTGNPAWPSLARVRIYRKGFDRPFVGVARWTEFYPGEKLGFMYRKMPCNQLAKCAEANGLRKAFPAILGDLYTSEEMQQADVTTIDITNEKSASVKSATSTGSSLQGETVDTEVKEINPLDEEITELLAYLTRGDYSEMEAMLKNASHYKQGTKEFSFSMDRLSTVSAEWKKKVLTRLRKWKEDADKLKEEISGGKEQPQTDPDDTKE